MPLKSPLRTKNSPSPMKTQRRHIPVSPEMKAIVKQDKDLEYFITDAPDVDFEQMNE